MYGLARLGSSMSVLDYFACASAISLRGLSRAGSACSIYGLTRLGSGSFGAVWAAREAKRQQGHEAALAASNERLRELEDERRKYHLHLILIDVFCFLVGIKGFRLEIFEIRSRAVNLRKENIKTREKQKKTEK